MTGTETKSPSAQSQKHLAHLYAECLRAYLECSDQVREVINDMVGILNDPDADEDERQMAVATMIEALFDHNSFFGIDLEREENRTKEAAAILREMRDEEAEFAERVSKLMAEKGIKQEELAQAIGVQQPAVSMLLSRNSRPQRRTVQRIAEALGVSTEELWPY